MTYMSEYRLMWMAFCQRMKDCIMCNSLTMELLFCCMNAGIINEKRLNSAMGLTAVRVIMLLIMVR